MAYLDAPKIIIAIFERAEFEIEDMSEATQGIPGGMAGGLRASAADYSRQGYSGGGGGQQSVRRPPAQPPEPEPLPPPEIPVPTPEPTTLVLLAVGSYLAFAGRRSRKYRIRKKNSLLRNRKTPPLPPYKKDYVIKTPVVTGMYGRMYRL
jgi:hypothetical protein